MKNAIVDVINLSWPTVVIVVSIVIIMRVAYIIRNDRKTFWKALNFVKNMPIYSYREGFPLLKRKERRLWI